MKKLIPEAFLNFLRWQKLMYQHRRANADRISERWKNEGRKGLTPHAVKQDAIRYYQKKYSINILVETGTFRGEMVYAQRNDFSKIYSIELSEELCRLAQKRLKKYGHIEILQGDSGKMLKQLVEKISEPAIFWLDGHYSGFETAKGDYATPVYQELDAIFSTSLNHVILIDDARLFVGKDDYPTIEELQKYVAAKRGTAELTIEDDMIRITPN